jgi:4-amino-4-deoxy-L-arabinose transferase-like glycosyltransferase
MQKTCLVSADAVAPNFIRRHWRFFLLFSVIAFAFRLLFLFRFRMLTADTFVYGDIARNWLETGIYAISGANGPDPTYIRMPGYPAFLAAIWKIVGTERYTAILIVQMFVDVGTCFLIADLTRRMIGRTTVPRPLSSRASSASEGSAVDSSSTTSSRRPHPSPPLARVGENDLSSGASSAGEESAVDFSSTTSSRVPHPSPPLARVGESDLSSRASTAGEESAVDFSSTTSSRVPHPSPPLARVGENDLSSRASSASEGSALQRTDRAPLIAFALASVCPFFASYSSAALTECLAIFFAALAFDLALAALEHPQSKLRWIACGLALAAGIFLRPDGGMLLVAIGLFLIWQFIRTRQTRLIVGLVLISVFSLAPLVPWTIRNWRLYHLFQPLTPVNANAPDEFVAYGFQRWLRTWVTDYSSMEDIWFNVPFTEIDIENVPPRAFDSPAQRQETEQLFDEYNNGKKIITPQLDFRFAQLADQRIHDSRFRYYVSLPVLRLADLWLRPRTEMLPIDVHWWRYWDDPHDFTLALLLAILNACYLIAAVIGAIRWRGCLQGLGIIFLFVVIRSVFLMYLPNPEPRYMLECYPAVIALAGLGLTPRRNNSVMEPARLERAQ